MLFAVAAAALLLLVGCNQPRDLGPDEDGIWHLQLMTIQLKPAFNEYMEGVIQTFEADHPNVRVEWLDFPIDGYLNKIQTLFFNDEMPDVINLTYDIGIEIAQQDVLQDLRPILEPEVLESYFPRILDSACTWNGEVFAVPWYLASMVTMYNRDILERAGLDPNHGPDSWDEAIAMSRQIQESEPGVFGFFEPLTESGWLKVKLAQEGIPIVERDEEGHLRAVFNTPEAATYLERWANFFHEGIIPRESLTERHPRAIELYKGGQTAFFDSGPQFLRQLREDAPDIYAVTDVAPGLLGSAGLINVDVMNLGVPDFGDTPEAQERERLAALLAAHVTNAANQLEFCHHATIFPSVAEVVEDPYFSEDDGTLEGRARIIGAQQMVHAQVLSPPIPESGRLNDAVNRAVERVCLGEATPQEALDEAVAAYNSIKAVRESGPPQRAPLPARVAVAVLGVALALAALFGILKRRRGGVTLRQVGVSYAFLAPALIILGLFAFYPMLKGLWLSFYTQPMLGHPGWVGLDNFRELIFEDATFHRAVFNSVRYLIVVPVIAFLSLALAILVEPALPGMGTFRALFYIPVVTTMIVVAFTWKFIFNEDSGLLNGMLQGAGLINEPVHWLTSAGIVLYSVMAVTTWKGLGYYMVIFLAGLRAIPHDIYEAARIDGAKPWQIIWNIKLPALRPTIQLVMIISSISAIQVFEEIYVMTKGKPDHASSTIVHMLYESSFDLESGRLDFGYASAMGVILFALLVVFTSLSLWLSRRSEEKA